MVRALVCSHAMPEPPHPQEKAEPESDYYDCCDYCGRVYPAFSRRAYNVTDDGELWYYCERHDCDGSEFAS